MSRSRTVRRALALTGLLLVLPVFNGGTPASASGRSSARDTGGSRSVSHHRPPSHPTRCPRVKSGVHRHAPGSGRTVALTFDDGPGRDTRRIMAILARAHVTATYFNLGVNEAQHHKTVRRQQRAGYLLGDHTWDHRTLTLLDLAGQRHEMDRERGVDSSITGAEPCVFRPPGGSYNATTLALAQRRGMRVWCWSVDTEDWKASGSGDGYWVQRIRSRAIAGGTQRHPVILMHNQPAGNPATVAALPSIIKYYKRHHYRFVDLRGHTART